MRRHIGRSKGCKTCRQRRIKCDEALPECTQCVSTQRKCTGPALGTVFVDMTTKTKQILPLPDRSSSRFRSNSILQERPCAESTSLVWMDKSSSQLTSRRGYEEGTTCETNSEDHLYGCREDELSHRRFTLPSTYQPSKAKPFQLLFLSQFVSDLDARSVRQDPMKAWWKELSATLENSSNQAALQSLRAMTMAHYGSLAKDSSIQAEARRWYVKALSTQRTLLHGSWGAEDVLSTTMLGIFELVLDTSPAAWFQHILAGSNLFLIRGPEHCQDGIAHKIFRCLRATIFSTCFLLSELRAFGFTEDWATVPFAQHPKGATDYFVDIIYQIPVCLRQYNFLLSHRELDTATRAALMSKLNSTAKSMVHALRFWKQKDMEQSSDEQYETVTASDNIDAAAAVRIGEFYECNDLSTSTLQAPEHAIHLVVHLILSYTSNDSEYHDGCVWVHANCILAAASILQSNGWKGNGPLMREFIFPLETVRTCSLDPLQIQSAKDLLSEWANRYPAKRSGEWIANNILLGPSAVFMFLNLDTAAD